MKTVLVPVDFSEATAPTLAAGLSLARATGSELVLLHVLPLPTDYRAFAIADSRVWETEVVHTEKKLEELLTQVRAAGVSARAKTVSGHAALSILDTAEATQADVIVMGSHGHTAFYDLLVGSTSSDVLRGATCPVMIVPGKKVAREKAALHAVGESTPA